MTCNPYTKSPGNTTAELILGLFFTFLSLLIVGGSTTKDNDETITGGMSAHMMEKEDEVQYQKVDLQGTGSKENIDAKDAHVFPISTATILFQALMILASIYFSMLMTNWGNPSVMEDTYGFFSANETSYWIQMSALWVSQAIYIFSLTAPLCFPNRDFGV